MEENYTYSLIVFILIAVHLLVSLCMVKCHLPKSKKTNGKKQSQGKSAPEGKSSNHLLVWIISSIVCITVLVLVGLTTFSDDDHEIDSGDELEKTPSA